MASSVYNALSMFDAKRNWYCSSNYLHLSRIHTTYMHTEHSFTLDNDMVYYYTSSSQWTKRNVRFNFSTLNIQILLRSVICPLLFKGHKLFYCFYLRQFLKFEDRSFWKSYLGKIKKNIFISLDVTYPCIIQQFASIGVFGLPGQS